MNRDELLDDLRRALHGLRGIDPDLVVEDARLADDLGLDSLDLAEVAVLWDSDYGVEFTDDDLLSVKTVRDAIDVLVARGGATAGRP